VVNGVRDISVPHSGHEAPGNLLPLRVRNDVAVGLGVELHRPRRNVVLSVAVRPTVRVLELHTRATNPHMNDLLSLLVMYSAVAEERPRVEWSNPEANRVGRWHGTVLLNVVIDSVKPHAAVR
jgi:hypothetical protein